MREPSTALATPSRCHLSSSSKPTPKHFLHPLLPRLQYVSDPIPASDRPPLSESETRHTLLFHTHSHHTLPPLPSRHHSPIRTLHRIVSSQAAIRLRSPRSGPYLSRSQKTPHAESFAPASAAYVRRGFFHRAHRAEEHLFRNGGDFGGRGCAAICVRSSHFMARRICRIAPVSKAADSFQI